MTSCNPLFTTLLGLSILTASAVAQEKPTATPDVATAAPAEASLKREPGVALRLYQFEGNVNRLPILIEGQTPNVSVKLDDINIKRSDDFWGLKDNFLTEISGFINVTEAGKYGFRLYSDDGSVLTINGKRVIDADSLLDDADPLDGSIQLSPGVHLFVLRHFELGGEQSIRLQWQPPGAKDWTLVPASAFTTPAGEVRVTAPGLKRITSYEDPLSRPGDARPLADVHPSFDLSRARPEGFDPKVGGIDFLPDGRMVICTWDPTGGVYFIDGHASGDPSKMTVKRFAAGLAEPLGIKVVDGRIFVLQKQELTELIDRNGDDVADEYRCVSADWNVTSNFHEFAFGLEYKDGFFYAALAVAIDPGGATTKNQAKGRGTVLKIGINGGVETMATGLRTPNGMGLGPDGELFVADNQGDWLPSSKLLNIRPGRFYNSHLNPDHDNADLPPSPPVVWLPQNEIANSPSQPLYLKDGPYKGQMLLGEVTRGGLTRVFLEQLDNEYQGAVFQFSQGFEGGVNRVAAGPDGSIYVGQIGSSGNWGQAGKKSFGLQRLKFNGKTAFEPLAVRAMTDGFEIEFTEPLAKGDGEDPADYFVQEWRYEPTKQYGGPKVDVRKIEVSGVTFSGDRRRVFVPVPEMKAGHVYYFRLGNAWQSASGQTLWVTEAWYTLNRIPAGRPGPAVVPAVRLTNQLSAEEQADGWQLLFDGESADQWRGYRKQTLPDGWRIENGTLTRVGAGGDIVTKQQFDNFELQLDWRVAPGGNSGVFYRASEALGAGWMTGPEMQILDNKNHADGKNPLTSAGSAYAIVAPTADVTKPVGAWNTARLVVRGKHVEHWLNGKKIVEYEFESEAWKAAVANSKFKDVKSYGRETKGHIVLQDHGDVVAFRNIKIRPLPAK